MKAQLDFVRLTGEAPSSLYFEHYLQSGDQKGAQYKDRFPGIANWPGIAGLKRRLCKYAGCPPTHRVALGSRSGSMFEIAADALLAVAGTVLVTDLTWLPHLSRLKVAAQRRNRRIVFLRLRDAILSEGLSPGDVLDRITAAYIDNGCEAIVLPKVDNLGIKLPVGDILATLRQQAELRFSIVDAAQALGHVALDDCWPDADVLLAGTHKWLCAGQPLSLAFYGRPQSKDIFDHYAYRSSNPRANHDPLLGFAEQLSGGQVMNYAETVNIAPLFACFGALADVNRRDLKLEAQTDLGSPRDELARLVATKGWRAIQPHASLRSRILLLQNSRNETENWPRADFAAEMERTWIVGLSVRQRPCSHFST